MSTPVACKNTIITPTTAMQTTDVEWTSFEVPIKEGDTWITNNGTPAKVWAVEASVDQYGRELVAVSWETKSGMCGVTNCEEIRF